MGKIILILVLLTLPLVCYGQENTWNELNKQAQKLFWESRYDEAIEVAKEALQIAEKEFGSESLRTAESAGNLGAIYRYLDMDGQAEPFLKRARTIRGKHGIVGTPIGFQTEVFFEKVGELKGEAVARAGTEAKPQTFDSSPMCDLDGDNDCDSDDLEIFRNQKGKSIHSKWNATATSADIDGDLCVTEQDEQFFLQAMESHKKE
jgi:tetratricopeptide (TPR) repeat protein